MKVLILNIYDDVGGAARAAYRLHKALLGAGVQSIMLVQKKLSDDYSVVGGDTIKQKLIGQLKQYVDQLPVMFYRNKSPSLFSSAWFSFGDILNKINKIQPDIVHLHWVCKGMLSIDEIRKIKAPIVWTLHDSWPFTGGCHIPGECKKYTTNCGSCPLLGSSNNHDLSSKVFNKKLNNLKLKKIYPVAVSRWLQNCAEDSSLFNQANVKCIPNAIDTNAYAPIEKSVARSILNIGGHKQLVLFGAMSATSDLNKGYQEFVEAINQLKSSEIEIVIFGSGSPKNTPTDKFKIHYLGQLHDDISLKVIYSAADVMVVPSLIEAFGQTASEAMACGTPVVAFHTTGLLDIIEHKENGYLARAFDTTDLARGIDWVLSAEKHIQLSRNARNKVLNKYDSKVVVKQYIDLYEQILADKQS